MDFILPKYLRKDIAVTTITPPYDQGTLMPFVNTVSISGSFGSMQLQSFHRSDFSLYQHIFHMKRKANVKVDAEQPMITLTYVLKGTIPCKLNGFGKATLSEGWYHLYYVPEGKHIASMPEGEAVILQVNFYASLLQELGNKYLALREVCENVMSESKRGLQQGAAEITPKIRVLLNSICNCKLTDAELDLFLRARIYDLLLLYLEELNTSRKIFNTRYHFTDDDLKALHKAGDLLLEHIHEPLHQQVLARYVHLHPKKLAEGFRMVHGVTIHEWISKTRIDKAKQLLTNTSASIHEIALEVGYATTAVFTRAFKSMVGCTPKGYRK